MFTSSIHNIAIWVQTNGNMICSLNKAEIQLFEVRIRVVELYKVTNPCFEH